MRGRHPAAGKTSHPAAEKQGAITRSRRAADSRLGAASVEGCGCSLQTDDIDGPARRLYARLGFTAVGYGPQALNQQPGLVMFRPPAASNGPPTASKH